MLINRKQEMKANSSKLVPKRHSNIIWQFVVQGTRAILLLLNKNLHEHRMARTGDIASGSLYRKSFIILIQPM
jgi:capsular polysaccharide biosynthesis protein